MCFLNDPISDKFHRMKGIYLFYLFLYSPFEIESYLIHAKKSFSIAPPPRGITPVILWFDPLMHKTKIRREW